MDFRLINDMFLNTVFTQIFVTVLTVHGGHGEFTQGTAENILPTVVVVHELKVQSENERSWNNWSRRNVTIEKRTLYSSINQRIKIIETNSTTGSSRDQLFL